MYNIIYEMSHQSRFDARYFLAFLKGSDFVWDVGVWLEVLGFETIQLGDLRLMFCGHYRRKCPGLEVRTPGFSPGSSLWPLGALVSKVKLE